MVCDYQRGPTYRNEARFYYIQFSSSLSISPVWRQGHPPEAHGNILMQRGEGTLIVQRFSLPLLFSTSCYILTSVYNGLANIS